MSKRIPGNQSTMNIIDLELYKWHWQNLTKISREPFISTLPRQSGKTTMLMKMANILDNNRENFLIIVPTMNEKQLIKNKYKIDDSKIFILPKSLAAAGFVLKNSGINNYKDINLLVDEYTCYNIYAIKELLRLQWKSISMVGTFL